MKRLVFPSDESVVTLHSSLLAICDENRYADLLLAVLICPSQATSALGDDSWLHTTLAQLCDAIFHQAFEKATSLGIQNLRRKDSIVSCKPAGSWNRTKEYAAWKGGAA